MSYDFVLKDDSLIIVEKLTRLFCIEHRNEILEIINIIPHISWTIDDLLSQSNDYYGNKWNYSYVIKHGNVIVGVLIAYFRHADDKHIFDSLYIHRFAIRPDYQKRGIGTEALKYFIGKSFSEIPWLLNISCQTNNCRDNDYVIQFYKSIGFVEMYNVYYSDKIDILFLLEREKLNMQVPSLIVRKHLSLPHPRLSVFSNFAKSTCVLPTLYFSSTNEKKKRIIKFILNNYNIRVSFVKPPIEMTEPQVEEPTIAEERKLVSLPLKAVSRFIETVPYVIEDTMLFIEYFNRNGKQWELPGLDTKRWLRQIELEGLLQIMNNTKRRRARFVSQTGAYVKAGTYYYGRGEIEGYIANYVAQINNPRYGTYPFFFHRVFIPDGANKTLAEMDMFEYAKYDYMRKSINDLLSKLSQLSLFQVDDTYEDLTFYDFLKDIDK